LNMKKNCASSWLFTKTRILGLITSKETRPIVISLGRHRIFSRNRFCCYDLWRETGGKNEAERIPAWKIVWREGGISGQNEVNNTHPSANAALFFLTTLTCAFFHYTLLIPPQTCLHNDSESGFSIVFFFSF